MIHDIFLKTDTGINSIFTTLNLYEGHSGLGLHCKMNLDDIKDFKSGIENKSTKAAPKNIHNLKSFTQPPKNLHKPGLQVCAFSRSANEQDLFPVKTQASTSTYLRGEAVSSTLRQTFGIAFRLESDFHPQTQDLKPQSNHG